MRLDPDKATFLTSLIKTYLPQSKIYLFGSRVDESKKGGDIDILIIAERELSREEKAKIEFAFFQRFGEQKLDLVSFRSEDQSAFRMLSELEAVAL